MKKLVFGLLCLSVILLTGCSVNLENGKYKEGTYEGTAVDNYGGTTNTASAKITVDDTGKIASLFIDTTYTTDAGVVTTKKQLKYDYKMKEYNPSAAGEWFEQIEALEKTIVDNQGVDNITLDSDGYTDAVSGCTIKIDAIMNAVNDALTKAK